MKVLWTHNFDPLIESAGIFMHQFATGMLDFGVDLELYYTGPLRSILNIYRAHKEIALLSQDYDIVHSQFGSACSIVTAGVKTKKIVSLRGSDWYRYKGNSIGGSIHSLLASSMTRLAILNYETVIVMSNRMAKEVNERYSDLKLYTLPDPIDLNKFQPIDKIYARKKLFGTSNNEPWILLTTISKSNTIKRIWLAQRAVEIASKEIGDIKLKIATGVPFEMMPLFVASCDLILNTSIHEGWPNAIKEALACNVPFVSTDVSDLAEIAKVDQFCRISDPDPMKLAVNICQILEKGPNSNLRSHVENMGIEKTCEYLYQIYRETLQN